MLYDDLLDRNFANDAGDGRKDADDRNQLEVYRPWTWSNTHSELAKPAGLSASEKPL